MNSSRLPADAARFLVAGAINTTLTTAIYFTLQTTTSSTAAYTVAWLIGLVFVAAVYPDHVFRRHKNRPYERAVIAAIFLLTFVAGLFTLRELTYFCGSSSIAFAATVPLTTTINFFLSRIFLRGRLHD